MGKQVHLQVGHVITWVVATYVIPEGKPTLELIKKLDEQDPESSPWKLMQLLWQEGGLDELAQWTPECARKFEQMLMKYHDVISLECWSPRTGPDPEPAEGKILVAQDGLGTCDGCL